MKELELYDKREIAEYVYSKMKKTFKQNIIDKHHIIAIASILFDEMISDLKEGKAINISNFAIIDIKQMPSRKYHHFLEGEVKEAPGNKLLRFRLALSNKKLITSLLDFAKLLRENYSDNKKQGPQKNEKELYIED